MTHAFNLRNVSVKFTHLCARKSNTIHRSIILNYQGIVRSFYFGTSTSLHCRKFIASIMSMKYYSNLCSASFFTNIVVNRDAISNSVWSKCVEFFSINPFLFKISCEQQISLHHPFNIQLTEILERIF